MWKRIRDVCVNGRPWVTVGVVILLWREGWNAGITLLTPENLFTGFTGIAALAVVLQATSGIIAAGVLRYVDNIADLFAHAGAMFITVSERGGGEEGLGDANCFRRKLYLSEKWGVSIEGCVSGCFVIYFLVLWCHPQRWLIDVATSPEAFGFFFFV